MQTPTKPTFSKIQETEVSWNTPGNRQPTDQITLYWNQDHSKSVRLKNHVEKQGLPIVCRLIPLEKHQKVEDLPVIFYGNKREYRGPAAFDFVSQFGAPTLASNTTTSSNSQEMAPSSTLIDSLPLNIRRAIAIQFTTSDEGKQTLRNVLKSLDSEEAAILKKYFMLIPLKPVQATKETSMSTTKSLADSPQSITVNQNMLSELRKGIQSDGQMQVV